MKIGIVTHYYKSENYGGNLQAYALCKVLERFGVKGEQLCILLGNNKVEKVKTKKKKTTWRDVEIAVHVFIYNILIAHRKRNANKCIHRYQNAVLSFNQEMIPHSVECYTEFSIKESTPKYDAFITGSDMVWHPAFWPAVFANVYSLRFVPDNMPKFSYAPSLGLSELDDRECEIFRNFLGSYQAVSVREQQAVSLLKDLSPVPVEWVLDPTLIVGREEWDEICTDRRVNEPYVFCCFLGDNTDSRKAAKEYAKKNRLKLVTIPYLRGAYRRCDWKFGDIQLSDVSPADFLSLIRYSEAVFTDSFHACVFSFLYHRDMYAFRRNAGDKWGSRIQSFLELIGCSQRYCDTDEKECLEYIESLPSVDYSAPFTDFEIQKKKSLDYLERNLKLAEETIQKNAKKN